MSTPVDPRQTLTDLDTQEFFWERYTSLGKEAFQDRNFLQAIKMFTLAQKTANTIGDPLRKAQAMSWMALIYYELHNFAEAEQLLKQVIDQQVSGPEFLEEHQNYQLLALLYEQQGKYNDAEVAYRWLLHDYQNKKIDTSNPEVLAILKKCDELQRKQNAFQPSTSDSPIVWDFSRPN